MADFKEFLLKLSKNRNVLLEREAKYAGNAPLDLLNQIEDHEEAIELTQQVITGDITESEWREALGPLLLAVDRGQVVKLKIIPRMAPPLPQLFIGRNETLTQLISLLKLDTNDKGPMVLSALKGMGGVGKTTLATVLANHPDVEAALSDGTLWASLGPEPDVMTWLATWGKQFGEDFADYASPDARSRALSTLLHDKKALLIIDDVWQADEARYFLVGGSGCRALITTRDNQVARTLASRQTYLVETLTKAASFDLLQELASGAVVVDKKGANELAVQLGGLPLALTLAGRMLAEEWEAGLGVEGALTELKTREARLELAPAEKRVGLAAEIPSLQAVLGMSYDRLPTEKTQQAFRLLGVFGGKPTTFSLEAAAAIWQMEDRDTAKTMVTLVNRALVEPTEKKGRFTLHTTLADFATNLMSDRERSDMKRRHVEYFFRLAERVEKHVEDWPELDVDWENIRAGANWLSKHIDQTNLDNVDLELVANFFLTLLNIIHVRKPSQSEVWLQAGVSACHLLGRTVDEARITLILGTIVLDRGFLDQAVVYYEQSAQLFEAAGDLRGVRYARGNLGNVHLVRGEYSQAIVPFELVTHLCEAEDDLYGAAIGHNNLGVAYRNIGETIKAITHLEASIGYARQAPPVLDALLPVTLGHLALLKLDAADTKQAVSLGEEAWQIADKMNVKHLQGVASRVMGQIRAAEGNLEESDHYFQESIDLLQIAEVQEELAEAHEAYSHFLNQMKRWPETREHLEAALKIFEYLGAEKRAIRVRDVLQHVPNGD